MSLSRILLLVTLSAGCASAAHDARSARDATREPSGALVASGALTASATKDASESAPRAAQTHSRASVAQRNDHAAPPLRHFYLLSPGPNATLVVTLSDLSTH